MMKSPTNITPNSGISMNIASGVSPPCTGISSMRVPPTFSGVGRSMVTSGLKLRTSSRLKRSPKKSFVEEGDLQGLLDAIDIVVEKHPRHLLHGHEPLTRNFGPAPMLAQLKT